MDLFKKIFGTPVEGMSAEEAKVRLAEKDSPFLLDVRQPEEFASEHIRGAVLIPLGSLPARMGELPKDREILCVCQSGSRSISASRLMAEAGYRVINLNGGMIAWMRAGLPVERKKR